MIDQAPELLREAIKNGIRQFCRSLGNRVVTVSSDGVERIYYSGISLDALSVAATMAATRLTPAERPVPQVREALRDGIAWIIDRSSHAAEKGEFYSPSLRALAKADAILALTARPSDAAVARDHLREWKCSDCGQWVDTRYSEHHHAYRPEHYDTASRKWVKNIGDPHKVDITKRKTDDPVRALPPDEPARVTPSTVGVEDIACEYSGVFGTPPRVCVNKDQCHRVGQCYYKKSPSQPAQNGRLKRSPTSASEAGDGKAEAKLRDALKEVIAVLESWHDDETEVELLPRLRAVLAPPVASLIAKETS